MIIINIIIELTYVKILYFFSNVLTMNPEYHHPRSYYENLKIDFANKKSYYGNRDQNWGEKYGYTLAEPYNLIEIQNYEKKYNITIPPDLRNYLLNISRETIGAYPYIVELDEPECHYFFSNNTITNSNCACTRIYNCIDPTNCIQIGDKTHDELITLGFNPVYVIKTHENGCTNDHFISVGQHFYGKKCNYIDGGDGFSIDLPFKL